MSNWRDEIADELRKYPGEEVIAIAPDASVLDVEFDDGYGTSHGPEFTAWSQTRVLFPVVYDGAEWVESVPRNPSDEVTTHVGGQ
jgi:hypothetical protein